MSMSKKDYQAIAARLHALKVNQYDPGIASGITYMGSDWLDASMVAGALADYMGQENERFDRARFIEACETGTTKGMRKREEKPAGRTCPECRGIYIPQDFAQGFCGDCLAPKGEAR